MILLFFIIIITEGKGISTILFYIQPSGKKQTNKQQQQQQNDRPVRERERDLCSAQRDRERERTSIYYFSAAEEAFEPSERR